MEELDLAWILLAHNEVRIVTEGGKLRMASDGGGDIGFGKLNESCGIIPGRSQPGGTLQCPSGLSAGEQENGH